MINGETVARDLFECMEIRVWTPYVQLKPYPSSLASFRGSHSVY